MTCHKKWGNKKTQKVSLMGVTKGDKHFGSFNDGGAWLSFD